MNSKTFFLGANTPGGFYSLFNELYNPNSDSRMFIIKGGPGTGKSSLMKKIAKTAEDKGYIVERIPCSSDPLSLDAVIIPEINTAIADGTAPHIVDPVFPGVCENIIDLGKCWNKSKLRANSSIIKKTTKENSNAHKQCVKYLKAASVIDNEINELFLDICDFDKIERFVKRLCNTELINIVNGSKKLRFLSAVTPLGIAVQYDSIFSECERIITIDDKYGVVSSFIIKMIDTYAEKSNIERILCLCPMNPENKPEHIIFSNKLAVFTANSYHPMIKKCDKTIHADRFIDKDSAAKIKNKLTFLKKAKLELIGESIKCLEEAKALHDILESYYIAAMDFSAVSKITEETINEIFK